MAGHISIAAYRQLVLVLRDVALACLLFLLLPCTLTRAADSHKVAAVLLLPLLQVAAHEAAIVVLMHPQGAPTPADAEALKAAAGEQWLLAIGPELTLTPPCQHEAAVL